MINLKEAYGKQYKIFMDEAWEHLQVKSEEDKPWYYEIRGRYGLIYSYDDTTLAVMVTSSNIKEHMGRFFKGKIKVFWEGDGEGVFRFGPELIHKIAEMIRAKKKRHLTDRQKEILNEGRKKGLQILLDKSKSTAQI